MKRTKNFLTTISFTFLITMIFFTLSCSTLKVETFSANMNTPETLVKNFIEDYFRWNEESSKKAKKLMDSESTELASIGITEIQPPFEKIKNNFHYAEIKAKYAGEVSKLMTEAEADYKKIIRKYCRPDYQHLNITFNLHSFHNPENEDIVSVNTVGSKSIVKTKQTKYAANTKLVKDWEYQLIYENNRWYLEQIFYFDDEGKYESL